MNEEAEKLAEAGLSNAEIFGKLNISSGALQALMQTDPTLLFSILKGRSKHIDFYRDLISTWAAGEEPMTKIQYQACIFMLERAEQYNTALTVSHDMVMLSGQVAPQDQVPSDPSKVTQLLRKTK